MVADSTHVPHDEKSFFDFERSSTSHCANLRCCTQKYVSSLCNLHKLDAFRFSMRVPDFRWVFQVSVHQHCSLVKRISLQAVNPTQENESDFRIECHSSALISFQKIPRYQAFHTFVRSSSRPR